MVIGLPLKGVYRTMRKISWIALGIIILPAISLCTNVPTARADDISNPSSASCSGGGSWQFGLCRTGQQDAAEVYGNDHQPRQTPGQQQPSSNPSTVNDQRAHLTADATAAPEAQRFWNWARCASVSIGTAPNDGHVSDEDCSIPFDPVTGTVTRAPAQLPTTRDLLLAAATIIHADGAGLHKRPEGVSYTNKHIPTLVAATQPTQAHTVTLLGHDITVTLTATSYTWSWGGWDPGSDHDLAGDALARRHGPQHGPRPDPPLLQGAQRMEVFPGRPLPLRHGHHHAHHNLGGHGHQPLHRRPSTAWSPPRKRPDRSRWANSSSTTPTPQKKNKGTRRLYG